MAHLHCVMSTATQCRLPGLPHPGTTKIYAPNLLVTSSARRELSFEVRSAWHHLVSCDVLFSPRKICFLQLHVSNHHEHRVCHHPPSTTRHLRGSSWRGDGRVWRWGSMAITIYMCTIIICTHLLPLVLNLHEPLCITQQNKQQHAPSISERTDTGSSS